jgi:signal transduction histidine kinase
VKSRADRIISRLIAIQVVAWTATGLLVSAFAPRLLLLDGGVVEGSSAMAIGGWLVILVTIVAATYLAGLRARSLLASLGTEGGVADPKAVNLLYSTPARLVVVTLLATLFVSGLTLVPPVRPETNDLSTQVELVLLVFTIASAALLPAYVAMRASVASTLELVPVTASRDAIELFVTARGRIARVRHRLLAAVAAPVAFVALGASLLVHAHLRAFDTSSRQTDVAELVEGVFDAVEGDVRGRDAGLEVARAHGLVLEIKPWSALFSVRRSEGGRTRLTVPLSDAHALVEFETARVSPWTLALVAIATVAIAIACILGLRIGSAFAADVAFATRAIEATGVADVLRGEHIRGDPRFGSVAALIGAADELGAVFREFANAQRRAIAARASTERTRGLFLASMSHDLKAPLNAILGFAEIVSRGPLTGEQRQSVSIIERRGRELSYLVETILDSARAEAGELSVSPEWTRVGDVVMPAVLNAREVTETVELHIVGEIQPGVPRILVDPERLVQALVAIILATGRFAEGGQVIVRAGLPAEAEQVRIDVEATGRGASVQDRENIFEAFEHLDRAHRHGSLGLGPSLARTIVRLHGGTIAVETTAAGGSVFHVWVPSERRAPRDGAAAT